MEKIEFFEKLVQLTEGKTNKIDCTLIASYAIAYLEEFGFEVEDCTEFNGWQCDYWYSAIYNDKEYKISGGAWYGDFEMTLEDEKDDDEGEY